ncbi:MAG: hypothetical protein MJE77_14395 [Proteobacteria bacterium]|nr:hypothetical protein [Pseudomonadota bacterium]
MSHMSYTIAVSRIAVNLAALALLLATASHAHAGDASGTVLKVEGDQVYVDIGAKDGVGAGSELVLMHVVTARDPVTGATLRDRFALGQLTVIKAGQHLALARAPETIRHRIRVGDEVELSSQPRAFRDPWRDQIAERQKASLQPRPSRRDLVLRARAEARKNAETAVVEARAAREAWRKTLGKAPRERIAVWRAYLKARPASPYAREVSQEIERLDEQAQKLDELAARAAQPQGDRDKLRVARLASMDRAVDVSSVLAGRSPSSVYQGSETELAFIVLAPDRVDRAWVYFRHAGQDSYRRIQLARDGDAYLRGALPGDVARPPGIDYFVEVAAPGGKPAPAMGSQEEPLRIAVESAVEETAPDIDDRSQVTLFVDYVDFDGGLGDGFDQYLHAEIDFMYRFYKPIYALRVGFGTLGGYGGPKNIIDESGGTCIDLQGQFRCERVSYNYAYTELEYRFSNTFAVMLRPQFGSGSSDRRADSEAGRCNTADTEECNLFNSLGLRARLRIGDERETNLTLGVGITQSIGTLFEAAFAWSVIPKFPIKLSAQVTDQPVPEDFGVRLIADVGWRTVSWVYPSLRFAYQARDADHSGVSGGIAANFDW